MALKNIPGRTVSVCFSLDTYSVDMGILNASQFINVIPFRVTRSVIPLRSIICAAKLMRPILSTRISSTGFSTLDTGRSIECCPKVRSMLPM